MMKQRTLQFRVKSNDRKKEYKNKMRENTKFYNACLRATLYRFYAYKNQIEKMAQLNIEPLGLGDWLTSPNVNIKQMESYGNNFLHIISEYTKSTLNKKEQQSIARQVARDWRSFFNTLKSKKVKNKRRVHPPYFKKEFMTCEFNKQMILKNRRQYEIKREIGVTGTVSKIKLPHWVKLDDIQAVRLKFQNSYVYVEVIYQKEIYIKPTTSKRKKSKTNVASIDPGLTKIVTMVFNRMVKPIAIHGNKIKHLNYILRQNLNRLNKLIELDPKNAHTYELKQLQLVEKRNKQVNVEIHKITNYIVDKLELEGVGKLVFGHNKGQKQKVKLRRNTKDKFSKIPYATMMGLLQYKCEDRGIIFVEVEESYTSQASFLSSDKMPVFTEDKTKKKSKKEKIVFSGKRVKRGLYKDNQHNMYIHADVNGAFNIMRKYGTRTEMLRKNIVKHKAVIEPVGVTI